MEEGGEGGGGGGGGGEGGRRGGRGNEMGDKMDKKKKNMIITITIMMMVNRKHKYSSFQRVDDTPI